MAKKKLTKKLADQMDAAELRVLLRQVVKIPSLELLQTHLPADLIVLLMQNQEMLHDAEFDDAVFDELDPDLAGWLREVQKYLIGEIPKCPGRAAMAAAKGISPWEGFEEDGDKAGEEAEPVAEPEPKTEEEPDVPKKKTEDKKPKTLRTRKLGAAKEAPAEPEPETPEAPAFDVESLQTFIKEEIAAGVQALQSTLKEHEGDASDLLGKIDDICTVLLFVVNEAVLEDEDEEGNPQDPIESFDELVSALKG